LIITALRILSFSSTNWSSFWVVRTFVYSFPFYEQLDRVLSSVPYHQKLILMGDFNARVGRDSEAYRRRS